MPDTPDFKIPWPGWRAVRRLGRGAYGSVWEIERDVEGSPERSALKVIPIPPEGEAADYALGYDEDTLSRSYGERAGEYVREYNLVRSLASHPNIVASQDVARVRQAQGPGWDVFIRMELLTPLVRWIGGRELSEGEVAGIGRDVACALAACEKKGIIHRDVKPANIMVDEWGDFKLGDFGVARVMEGTRTATMAGTETYMAPEVARRERYGRTVDIYSLGLVMYWALNGYRLPFMPAGRLSSGDASRAEARRLAGEEIPAPPGCSPSLARIVLRACAYRPEDRYQSASDMVADLKAFFAGANRSTEQPNTPPEAPDAGGFDSAGDDTVGGGHSLSNPSEPEDEPAQGGNGEQASSSILIEDVVAPITGKLTRVYDDGPHTCVDILTYRSTTKLRTPVAGRVYRAAQWRPGVFDLAFCIKTKSGAEVVVRVQVVTPDGRTFQLDPRDYSDAVAAGTKVRLRRTLVNLNRGDIGGSPDNDVLVTVMVPRGSVPEKILCPGSKVQADDVMFRAGADHAHLNDPFFKNGASTTPQDASASIPTPAVSSGAATDNDMDWGETTGVTVGKPYVHGEGRGTSVFDDKPTVGKPGGQKPAPKTASTPRSAGKTAPTPKPAGKTARHTAQTGDGGIFSPVTGTVESVSTGGADAFEVTIQTDKLVSGRDVVITGPVAGTVEGENNESDRREGLDWKGVDILSHDGVAVSVFCALLKKYADANSAIYPLYARSEELAKGGLLFLVDTDQLVAYQSASLKVRVVVYNANRSLKPAVGVGAQVNVGDAIFLAQEEAASAKRSKPADGKPKKGTEAEEKSKEKKSVGHMVGMLLLYGFIDTMIGGSIGGAVGAVIGLAIGVTISIWAWRDDS